MKNLIVNKQDYSRLFHSLKDAKDSGKIAKAEADRLIGELRSAQLLEPSEIPADVVTMNSIVKFHFEQLNKPNEMQIVYPADANLKEKKISIFSSVAIALIGQKVGDQIDWTLPSGPTKIIIDELVYQPEAAGDFDA